MGWFTSSSSHRPSYPRASSYSSFSVGGNSHRGSGSSYYKRRPRDNYMQQLLRKFKALLRELYHYARRHPVKIFFLVIMPLISGGVLHQFASKLGISLPAALRGSAGGMHGARGVSDGYYGSQGYGGGGAEGFANVGNLMKVAKMFM